MNIVIIGANRGIGLGFVRHYLAQGHAVWASHRQSADALMAIDDPHLHRFYWDHGDTDGDRDLAALGLPDKIDLLINNGGIYGPGKDGQSLEKITADTLREVFMIDCVGPLLTSQALLPRVIRARGRIANLSSKMGSSADNSSGGAYAYRAAKAALIIVSKSMAIDLGARGVRVITLHPGWVRTDMTGQSGLIDIQESVTGMAAVIDRIGDYPLGAFVAYDGQQIPY